ncbi:mitogen-activated protein kinase kinase kinase kinase 4-like isoform X1 [Selaginella moellendorffii]|uniref:mitogen-activated protein kinase kinase kinase kinase 4-like isoform X1 n=1 Tax=Selaginella moellendorffii TaxID=88036 RepID=UPI000D1CBABE|nr:mitogen-activated protein kinase kinase kinase kinase 4-like isoform X1 [Selaginella moellendorffii]XP_024528653.1 mitogen-activated protein kinase kinase kinase kinase 4-like isoform X1 [Selaginella moellendorffii]|eukprot:XP_024528652.1 mitogen-activated protein kinase kinase kinase kinase 4-like isoform X1 [Selaginella moellendorffii]
MCILCAGAKFSRRIVAMLPWLIIPFVIVWAFSQFLPPGYRFEITSTRLACVGVLLSSLFWYEFVVPNLSQWRDRRAILLRERQRIEAQKAARWRKEATKHCRNCHSPYRDQTPQASGKYMCTNCGHASKKPELHVPGDPRPRDLKLIDHSTCWRSLWEELDKQRFFHLVHRWVELAGKLLAWLWKKFCRQDGSRDGSQGRQQNAKEIDETEEKRGRARRKAEEKRLARLEREKKEEEERRDREEFKRLVDERSKLRAELLEAENASKREAAAERERELRRDREAEKKRQEKTKASPKEKELASDKSVGGSSPGSSTEEARTRIEKVGYFGRRRGYSYCSDYRNSRASSSSGGTPLGKHQNLSSTKIRTNAPAKSTSAAPPKEVAPPGTSMSWSKALCGAANTKVEACSASSEAFPKPLANGGSFFSKSAAAATTTSSKPQPLSPEITAAPPCQEASGSTPVSTDPIYFPGTAPVLPPISAPQHNTLTSEPVASSTSLFSSFFPSTTVLPPPTSIDATYSVMSPTLLSPVSRSVSSDFAWPGPFSQKTVRDPCIQLPEDICLSPSLDTSSWLPQYDYEVDNVPPEFLDCITRDIMVDPVTTADGHSYDRSTIKAWLKEHKTSPITGIELPPAPPPDNVDRTLRPNHVLRSQILDYNERKARERASRDGWPVTSLPNQQHQISCGLFISPGLHSMW